MKDRKNILKAVSIITAVNIINATVLLVGIINLSRYIDNDLLFTFSTMFFMLTYGAVSCYEVIKIEEFFKKRNNG